MGLDDEAKNLPLETIAEICADKLVETLGTADIPFCFRTSSGSVYAADKALHTVRLRQASGTFEPPSLVTVFIDKKYLDDQQTTRNGTEYLPNSDLHRDGYLAYIDGKDSKIIESTTDIPTAGGTQELQKLFFVVVDAARTKKLKQVPVSILPKTGYHPVEFFDPATRAAGARNHFGDVIESVTMVPPNTGKDPKQVLTEMLLENFKKRPPKL